VTSAVDGGLASSPPLSSRVHTLSQPQVLKSRWQILLGGTDAEVIERDLAAGPDKGGFFL